MTKKELEQHLAHQLSNLRKQVVGKGPEDMQVFIHGNTILIKSRGLWTPSEKFLISFINNKNLIKELYDHLLSKAKDRLEELLNNHFNSNILDITIKVYVEENEGHALILFDDNIEKKI